MPAKPSLYQKVNQQFYAEVAKENGGKLPADLTDQNGKPRKLTNSAKDRAYRKKWNAIAAKERDSKAVPNKAVTEVCVPCALKAAAAKIPPIVLPMSAGGAPKKLPSPPPPPPPHGKHPKQKETPCKHQTLAIECAHGGERAFKLQLPSEGEEEGTFIEVIDNGKEKLTCTTKLIAGPCGIHAQKVFDIYPEDSVDEKSDTQLVFRALHDEDFDHISFWELFHPSRARTARRYNIRTQTCQQEEALAATVVVYPQLDWEVSISGGVKAQRKISEVADDVYSLDDSGKVSINGSVALTVCGKKREFANEFSKGLQQNLKWAGLVFDTADFLVEVASKTGTVELSFTYPTFSLKGKWGWQEIEDSPKCGYATRLEIGASPLFGAAVQVDVLDVIIDAAPFGPALVKIKHALEKGARMGILLRVEGRVDLTFAYNKVKTQSVGDASGSGGGKVIFTLEGILQSKKFSFFCFEAGGEAKLGAHASFSGKLTVGSDVEGAYYKGFLGFDGLLVYAVVAATASIQWGPPPEEEEEEGFETDTTDVEEASPTQTGSETKKDEKGLSRGFKYGKTWTWIEKRALLGGDEKERHFFWQDEE